MRVLVIGAGSLGGQFAAHLARSGVDISLLDVDSAIVEVVTQHGLTVDGAFGRYTVDVPAFSEVSAAVAGGLYDAAFVHVDSNNTAAAGTSAKEALTPEGFCLQVQNGIGNVETLQAILGTSRVLGGSTMCSAANDGPGKPLLTHHGPTSIGEWSGGTSVRAQAVVALFAAAGYDALVDDDIQTKIWSKAILNAAINPLCAASGLRLGEMARTPEMNALQDKVLQELFGAFGPLHLNLDFIV
jgi:2-dehydropantoate 2-reductase